MVSRMAFAALLETAGLKLMKNFPLSFRSNCRNIPIELVTKQLQVLTPVERSRFAAEKPQVTQA